MITRTELNAHLDRLLTADDFADYCPNGLQIEGRESISRIVLGVSANGALIDRAIEESADALIVHHGFFWKNEPRTLVGLRARRVGALLRADLSLYAYHLPLDAHPEIGNNAGLLRAVGAEPVSTFSSGDGALDGRIGRLPAPIDRREFVARMADTTGQEPLTFLRGPAAVETIGVVTGGGAHFFEAAVAAGVDLFVTGEPSERSQGIAADLEANFVAAGHHATERIGPRLLGEHLAQTFDVEVSFIDIENPV